MQYQQVGVVWCGCGYGRGRLEEVGMCVAGECGVCVRVVIEGRLCSISRWVWVWQQVGVV